MKPNVRKIFSILSVVLVLAIAQSGCGREQGAVAPTPTAITRSSAAQGQTVAVRLTGTGFATGASINLTGTGITVSNTTVLSTTQISATFVIAPGAAFGPRSVTVTSSGATTGAQSFTVGLLPPTVSSTSPANGATVVATNRKVSVFFSKAMDPTTITTATFTVVSGGTTVNGTVVYDSANNAALFTPAAALAPNTTYTATIGAGAHDAAGNPLAINGSAANPSTFTTGPTADVTSPTVSPRSRPTELPASRLTRK